MPKKLKNYILKKKVRFLCMAQIAPFLDGSVLKKHNLIQKVLIVGFKCNKLMN